MPTAELYTLEDILLKALKVGEVYIQLISLNRKWLHILSDLYKVHSKHIPVLKNMKTLCSNHVMVQTYKVQHPLQIQVR